MPYDEFTLEHGLRLFSGEKKALLTNQLNPMICEKFAEHRQSVIIPQLMNVPEIWVYFVDKGDRQRPRWNREYTWRVLSSIKTDFVS